MFGNCPPRRGKGSLDSFFCFSFFVGVETPFLSSSMCAKEHLATKVLEQWYWGPIGILA